ncbi:hypothetical protein V492_02898 [Pseudogymnoascus sp. VKM F-4246]|nr:hypothetical protein V492_02898 [Pseudogymnoascus sp. VKM F-4246]
MAALGVAIATMKMIYATRNDMSTSIMATNANITITKLNYTNLRSAIDKIATITVATHIFDRIHHITTTAIVPGKSHSLRVSSKRNIIPENWWMNMQTLLAGFMNI